MDDIDAKIAQIESIRAAIGDVAADAAIAALRPPRAAQGMEASDGGSIESSPITAAGGDVRDSALGSGNLVLHDITIAAGGTLAIGALPADLPPRPEAIRKALASYLGTLLERYRYLSLQGLGTGGAQQMRVELNAVFINLRTNITIGEAAALFVGDTGDASQQMPGRTRGKPGALRRGLTVARRAAR
ncbi:MAG: hypothetical protein IPO81_19275 [Kouleothrix sp.]|nr:hypothetical protein [Kouleothrix sp.]